MKLKVERLSQNYWFWKWRKLGLSNLTIGNFGCYLTALCMMMRYKGYIYSVSTLNDELKKVGGFAGPDIYHPGVLSLLGKRWKYERKDWESVPAQIGVIQELIDSDFPVIAKVDFNPNTKNIDGHFVLIIGYELTNGKITDLIANDPWDGKEILICHKYPYLKLHKPENAIMGLRIFRQK